MDESDDYYINEEFLEEEADEDADAAQHISPNIMDGMDFLYRVRFQVMHKDFMSQLKGKILPGFWVVVANNRDEFLDYLWNKIKGHIQNEICIEFPALPDDFDETQGFPEPIYSQKSEPPTFSDMYKYCAIYDHTEKKKYTMDKITEQHLHSWTKKRGEAEKILWLYIYKYSSNVSNAKDYKEVQAKILKPIETDRSGAFSDRVIDETITLLKAAHTSLRGNYYSWQLLAVKILRQADPTTQSGAYMRLITQGPDTNMIHLFSRAYEAADNVLNNVRQNVNIASCINNNVNSVLPSIIEGLQKVQELHQEQDRILKHIQLQVQSLANSSNNNAQLLEEVRLAHQPAEHNFGINLSSQVVDSEDVDHQ